MPNTFEGRFVDMTRLHDSESEITGADPFRPKPVADVVASRITSCILKNSLIPVKASEIGIRYEKLFGETVRRAILKELGISMKLADYLYDKPYIQTKTIAGQPSFFYESSSLPTCKMSNSIMQNFSSGRVHTGYDSNTVIEYPCVLGNSTTHTKAPYFSDQSRRIKCQPRPIVLSSSQPTSSHSDKENQYPEDPNVIAKNLQDYIKKTCKTTTNGKTNENGKKTVLDTALGPFYKRHSKAKATIRSFGGIVPFCKKYSDILHAFAPPEEKFVIIKAR
jgi:hypothetical protein